MIGVGLAPTEQGIFIGGVSSNVATLCEGLARRGHNITVVTTGLFEHKSYQHIQTQNADIYLVSCQGSYLGNSISYGANFAVKALMRVIKLHKRGRFQIIAGHSGYPSIGLVTGIAGKLIRVPSVHTLMCPVEPKDPKVAISGLLSNQKTAKIFLSQVDRIIALTHNVRKSLENTGINTNKISVVSPAIKSDFINLHVAKERGRHTFELSNFEPVVLLVGNLTAQKGTYIALEAVAEIIKKYPKTKLVLTSELPRGSSDTGREMVQKFINKLGIGDNVSIFGVLQNLDNLMASADVIIAPFLNTYGISDYSLPILEAMAMGKPVITTKVGGMPEIITNNENGILVDVGDVDTLVNAIMALYENKQFAQMLGENAREFIRSHMLPDRVIEETEAIYEKVSLG